MVPPPVMVASLSCQVASALDVEGLLVSETKRMSERFLPVKSSGICVV